MHCAPHILCPSLSIDYTQTNIDFFIMQFFRTCDKCKGNMYYKGRLLACRRWPRRLKHWATIITIWVQSPTVTFFFTLGNSMLSILPLPTKIIIYFSLVPKTMGNAELPAWCINCGRKIRGSERSLSLFCRKHKTEYASIFALGMGCEVWIFLKNRLNEINVI